MKTLLNLTRCLLAVLGIIFIASPSPVIQAAETVNIVLQPASHTVDVGEEFDVEIQVESEDQEVVAAAIYLNFDPTRLAVIDADKAVDGVQIFPGTTLDAVFENEIDNAPGHINFSATKLGPPFATGCFSLATIKFRALASAVPSTAVNFETSASPRITMVSDSQGNDITGVLSEGVFTINSPDGLALAAPTNLTAKRNSSNQVKLKWMDNSDDEDGFIIETAIDESFTGSITITVGPDETDYLDTSVYPGDTFFYIVSAFKDHAISDPSNVASVHIPLPNGDAPPAAPTGLSANVSGTTVKLTWTDNSNNEVGFNIDRAADNSFNTGLTTIDLGPDVTSYSDTNLAAGTYYYRIRAYNAVDVSNDSNTVKAVIGSGTRDEGPGDDEDEDGGTGDSGSGDDDTGGSGSTGTGNSGGGGGTGGDAAPSPMPGVTELKGKCDGNGKFYTKVTAMSDDGKASVFIPGDSCGLTGGKALSRISIFPVINPPQAPVGNIISTAYDFGPDGAVFDPGATIVLKYSPSEFPAGTALEDLKIAFWNGSNWEALTSSQVDINNSEVSALVNHFSVYAITVPERVEKSPGEQPASTTASFSINPESISLAVTSGPLPPPQTPDSESLVSRPAAQGSGRSLNYWIIPGSISVIGIITSIIILISRNRRKY